ncbi:MAG: S-adenosylmethionine decarboxylase, partial [Pseudomonas aeruginosa]
VNVYQENLFHTKMLLKDFELENYLFGDATRTLSTEQREQVTERLKHEMLEIFYARNMPR